MRAVALSISLLLLASCAGASTESSAVPSNESPATVTSRWIEGVALGDPAEIGDLVEPVGLAVVAAVEGDLRSDELVGLLETGIGGQLAEQYWADFRDSFLAFQGVEITDVSVGAALPIAGADSFVSVELAASDATGQVVLRNTAAGWQIDFAATIGPALVGPLGEYLNSASAGEHSEAIAGAYRDAILPGLEAAQILDPLNSRLEFETEYIRQLAGP